jgi:hypothetical protein
VYFLARPERGDSCPAAPDAKVNATDDQGRTPPSWAGDFGQGSEIGDWLIEHGGRSPLAFGELQHRIAVNCRIANAHYGEMNRQAVEDAPADHDFGSARACG